MAARLLVQTHKAESKAVSKHPRELKFVLGHGKWVRYFY